MRLATIVLVLVSVPLRADESPKHSPAVKLIIDEAEGEVAKNRQVFDEANEKSLDTARRELGEMASQLIDNEKREEARAVLKQIQTLETDVLQLARAPQTDPQLLARAGSFLGTWKYRWFRVRIDEQGRAHVVHGDEHYSLWLQLASPDIARCGEWLLLKVADESIEDTVVALPPGDKKPLILSRAAPAPVEKDNRGATKGSAIQKILFVAAEEVRANLLVFDEANEEPLSKARNELKLLAKKLIAEGEEDQVSEVLSLAESVEMSVLGIAQASQPMPAGKFKGKWRCSLDRDIHLSVDDSGMARIEHNGHEKCHAQLKLTSENSAECRDWLLQRLDMEDREDTVVMLMRHDRTITDAAKLIRATRLERPEWMPLGLYHYTQPGGQKTDITIAKDEVAFIGGQQGSWRQYGGPALRIQCAGEIIWAKKGSEPGTLDATRGSGTKGTLQYSEKQPQ